MTFESLFCFHLLSWMLVIANVGIRCLQFCNPVLLPDIPADSTDLEGKARRSQVLAEVQGDLGRVLQARALEDPTLCVLVGSRYLALRQSAMLKQQVILALSIGLGWSPGEARALEDPTLCVHAVLAEFLYVIPGTFMFRVG